MFDTSGMVKGVENESKENELCFQRKGVIFHRPIVELCKKLER